MSTLNQQEILKMFKSRYGHLKKYGLEIGGIANLDYENDINVISVSHPFIFDHRLLPKEFEGLTIRGGVSGDLPKEFQEGNRGGYIWAPKNFESFVDRAADEIKRVLGNPDMTRNEMLDALCFGDFERHKKRVEYWVKEGKLHPIVWKKRS